MTSGSGNGRNRGTSSGGANSFSGKRGASGSGQGHSGDQDHSPTAPRKSQKQTALTSPSPLKPARVQPQMSPQQEHRPQSLPRMQSGGASSSSASTSLGPLLPHAPSQQSRKLPVKKDLNKAYERGRYYTGTDSDSKASIQEHGMSLSRKIGGATKSVEHLVPKEFVENANAHNYLSKSIDEAARYSNTQTRGAPKITRVFVSTKRTHLHPDPDSGNDTAFRTKRDIPASNVLPSKKAGVQPPGAASEVLRKNLKRKGFDSTSEEAARYLHEAQSDSDDDDPIIKRAGKMGTG